MRCRMESPVELGQLTLVDIFETPACLLVVMDNKHMESDAGICAHISFPKHAGGRRS